MRSLFIVVSKVYGLMQIYAGLTYIFAVIPMLGMLSTHRATEESSSTVATTFHGNLISLSSISMATMVILTFGMAWILLFRADWLADKLSIPQSDSSAPPSVETLLIAGTKLIGLYIVVQGLPLLIQGMLEIRHFMHYRAHMWSSVTLAIARIAIGAFLVLKTEPIVNFLTKGPRIHSQTSPPDETAG